jgi:putative endonuclease
MTLKTQTDERSTTLCHRAEATRATAQTNARGAVSRAGAGKLAPSKTSTASVGAKFEAHALVYLQRQRLRFVARNVRCRGGELDLVMRDADGTLVFVEVRARSRARHGGASASVGPHKRERLVRAAQYYLATHPHEAAACRFDVVAFEAGRLVWLRDAFRADDS